MRRRTSSYQELRQEVARRQFFHPLYEFAHGFLATAGLSNESSKLGFQALAPEKVRLADNDGLMPRDESEGVFPKVPFRKDFYNTARIFNYLRTSSVYLPDTIFGKILHTLSPHGSAEHPYRPQTS